MPVSHYSAVVIDVGDSMVATPERKKSTRVFVCTASVCNKTVTLFLVAAFATIIISGQLSRNFS